MFYFSQIQKHLPNSARRESGLQPRGAAFGIFGVVRRAPVKQRRIEVKGGGQTRNSFELPPWGRYSCERLSFLCPDLPMSFCGPSHPIRHCSYSAHQASEAGRFFIMHWYSWTNHDTYHISQEVTKMYHVRQENLPFVGSCMSLSERAGQPSVRCFCSMGKPASGRVRTASL